MDRINDKTEVAAAIRQLLTIDRGDERLAGIQSLFSSLSRALTIEQIADFFITDGLLLLGASSGGVFLLDQRRTRFCTVRALGFPSETLQDSAIGSSSSNSVDINQWNDRPDTGKKARAGEQAKPPDDQPGEHRDRKPCSKHQ